ncbi:glucose-6-phosphate 1-dehydrogenase, cytoplasmic isoform-like [Arachis hypogaea]|uniref:glucose-6-phosphate 1-dehydrogenase, cytoplasmic isoform-like n=1 Tax=Arachis hypogaea TaxID=3818 RepID=UPI003B2103D8
MTTSPNPPIFVWYNAFNPHQDSSQHNIHLEKASVLFNLGAFGSHIALSCDLTTLQGQRIAINALHDAAYWFLILTHEAEKVSLLYWKAFELSPLGPLAETCLVKSLIPNYLGSNLRTCHNEFIPKIIFKEDFRTKVHGGYFDQYGIIRDIIQNHLLQVLCLVAMERPVSLNPEHIQDERVKVLESVVPIGDNKVVLGQYEGYRDDPTVPNDSNTPTFAAVILCIHNEKWKGVPFILKAGMALNSRKTEIRVQFKDVPDDIFKDVPHEIFLKFSGTYKLGNLKMSTYQSEQELSYRRGKKGIGGDQQQFLRRDELEASWKIFTPILHRIDRGEFKPLLYEAYGKDNCCEKRAMLKHPLL